MKTLVVLLMCSFTASVYSATNVGDVCSTSSSDCDTIANSECRLDGSVNKCLCKSGHQPDDGNTTCVPKTVGDSCIVDIDDCQYIANSDCSSDICACTAGHEANAGDSSCAVVELGGSCTTQDDCRNIVNSECVNTSLTCTCKSGYSNVSGNCDSNKIGSTCAFDTDCSKITNAKCDVDDTNQCVCNSGHTGEADDSSCSPIALNDACTENGNDCVSVANAECRNEGGFKCLCLTGYYASGQTCMITECGAPAVSEGYSLGSFSLTTYQSQVSVTCATGYEDVPVPSTILCQADGNWTTTSGCDKVECGPPSVSPPYTVNTPSSTNFQSTAPVNCTTGYKGMPAAITCQANMTWTAPTGCTIVDCDNPTTTGYTFGTVPNTEYNSSVDVDSACATGYAGTPNQSSITCQASGFWDTVTGCSIKECPLLDPFTNGELNTTAHTYETAVSITCHSTHKLSGVSTLTCQSDATWSQPHPTCIEKTVPQFTAPVTGANTASVAENAAVDTSVFTVDASDTDGDNLTFTILSQTPGTNFNLDGSVLRVNTEPTLDFESETTTYMIQFQVSDEENNVASVNLTVTVTDVNEAPKFTESTKSVEIPSGVVPPVVVTTMGATDIDDADPTLTYAISAGDSNFDFSIDVATGAITTNKSIAYTSTPFILVITATDSGHLVTTGTVEVSMVSAPVLTMPSATSGSMESLNENTNTGVTLIALASTDADNDSPTYTIKSQTDNGAFAINGSNLVTGMVFDYETGPTTHEVVIEVTDDSSLMLSSTGTLTVNIVDVDEPPDFDPSSYTSSLKENSGAQASFLQVTATDPDHGDSKTYFITGSSFFNIDQLSGWISTNDSLVYATASSYSLTVTVTDNTTLSATASVDITVIPESIPQILLPVSGVDTIHILEDTAIGTLIYTVSATDDDGDILKYNLTSGSPDFSLDSRSVEVAQQLDFDTGVKVYEVKVEVSDQNAVPSIITATVTVSLTDVNDNAPVFSGTPYTVDVLERMASMQIIQVAADDADSSLNEYNVIQFSIQGGNTGSFSIDSTTGWISADNLDFGTASSHTLAILAKDLNGETGAQETTVNVSVNVITAPVLTMPDAADGSSHSLDETTNTGETVVTLASTDEDGDNQIYTIVSQTESGAFAINGSNLVTGTVFDYETLPHTYEVVIMVTDDSSESLTSTGTLTVNIADINDEDPVFNPNIYSFSIKEQTGVHTSFLQVMATDPDHGDTITYSIEGSGLFDIDTASGHISTTGELSYSAAPSYSLTVAATDNVSHNATASVQINVTEETSPQFIVPSESVGNTTELPENITVGTAIITIYATDADGDTLTYHLTSETTEFSLNSSTRVVTVAQALDFDTQTNVYMLTFEARDENSATSTATLTASVTDVNDNAPVFSESSYMVAVMEGIPGSRDVIQVTANDADSGLNAEIQYSINSGDTDGKLTIDATTGWISATTLNFTAVSSYTLVVSAKDLNGGLGAHETTVTVTVSVTTNVQFINPPVLGGDTISIPEDTAINTIIYQVSATDADGDELTYVITSSSTKFSLDSTTRNVTVTETLDFETAPIEYMITFEARDENDATSTATLAVSLTDANDNAPVFSGTLYTVDAVEGKPGMTQLIQVAATDADTMLNDNNKIQFSIKSGNADNKFTIDGSTGQISANTLAYTSGSFYTLVVAAKDLNGSPGGLETTATVNVSVITVPFLTMPNSASGSTQLLAEDTSSGGIVVALNSTDADGNNSTYAIVSQSVTDAFAITNAYLITNMVFNYESEPNTYEVVIQVTDDSSQHLTSTGTLTVNITNVNDESPVFGASSYSDVIKEKIGAHASFLQVAASDPDIDDTITFSIADSALFVVDATTGWISTTADLIYQTASSHSVTVTATDEASHTATANVNTAVIQETDPEFTLPPVATGDTIQLSENTAINTTIYTISAADDDGDTLTYHLTSGAPEFSLDSSTRVVKVAEKLDYDVTPAVHLVVFEARDQNDATSTATLTASLTDVNDNAPVFSGTPYSTDVVEGLPGTTQIIQVNATDDDSSLDNYNSIQFSIQSGNTENKFTIDATSGQISATTLEYDILNNYNLLISAKDLNGALGFLETTDNVVVNVLGDCGVPVQEGYAFSNIDKTSYQGTADVACDTGYEGNVNPTTITCKANKMWTTASECVRKVVESSCTAGGNDCSLIPNSECGNGNKCLCKTGYRGSNGDQSCTAAVGASCSAIGNECSTITNGECGTGNKCVCKASYIGSIGDANCAAAIGTTCTTNGNECATVTHGECGPDATCACITGYIGNTGELTCTAAVGSICIPGGSECNNVSNSDCDSDNKCSCKYGFAGNIGDENCVTITCGGPPTVAYTSVSLSKNGDDVTATYICLTGYQPTQDSTTTKTCTPPDSTWSNDDIQCEIKGSCPADPPAVNFATISLSDDGNTATYTCDIGHKLQDISVNSVACNQASTEWNNPAVVCEDKDCGQPITLAPQNGHVSLNVEGVTTFGAVATIRCDNGYDISGGLATLTCQSTEEWTQHSTICSIKDCGKTLPQPTNGATVLDDSEVSTYNATATQSCNDGYTPSGATQLICRATGQWAQITLNCNIKDCGKLYAPQYGHVNTLTSTSSSQYGDFASFTCEGGFQLNGLSHRVCQSNGVWNGTANPTCDIKSTCRTPTVVSRATYGLNDAGTEATYTCYDGYQLANTNQNILTCTTQDTVWSGTSPACALKGDSKRLISTMSLDINMDTINLSDLRIKHDFMTKAENSIKGKFIDIDISLHLTDIRIGSLIVDFEVVLPNNAITQFIDAITNLLASNDTIEIDGLSGEVKSIQADDVTYAANNVDSYRCAAFEILQGPCVSGYECVVADGEAVCRVRKESDNFALIIGVGVGVPLGLLTIVFVVVIGIYVTRRSQRNDRYSDSETSEDERRHFPNRIAKRYTGGYGQSSSAFYGPQQFEILPDSPLPSRRPPGTGEPPLDSNFSWDFLYNQYPPGKKFEIRRPKY